MVYYNTCTRCGSHLDPGEICDCEQETMEISGREYPIVGWHEVKPGMVRPIVDINLMSDERWNESALENAVENYRRKFGVAPESVDVAVAWQREEADRIVRACEGAEAV